jgi:hypothetical protein
MTRLYPTTNEAFINGVPAVEQEVDDEEAERLLSHFPPAFTTEPPAEPAETDADKPAEPAQE